MSEAAIQEAMKAEHVFMQDEIERWQYEQREKAMRDYISGMRAWRREGLKQGIEQGIEQGLKQGLKQGIQQGVMQASLQNIKNLMENMNLSASQAMDALQIPAMEREKYTNLLHS